MKKLLPLLFAFVLANAAAKAQSGSFSLAEAQKYAVENSPLAKMSEIEIEKAKKKVWETKAIGLPQVSGSAAFQHYINIPKSLVPATAFNPLAAPDDLFEMQFQTQQNANAGITATQLIFNGSYLVGLRTVKSFMEAAQQEKNKSENDIREAVSNAYFSVLVSQENEEVLRESLTLTNKTLEETKGMYKEGFVEEQDYMQLELMVGTLQNNYDNAVRQTGLAMDLLKFQMGLDMNQQISLKDNLQGLMDGINPEAANAPISVTRHPEFLLAKTQLRLAELNLSNERSKYLPSLSGFFSHSVAATGEDFELYESTATGDRWFPGTFVGVNLNLPIFTSGRQAAVVKQALLDHQKATIGVQQLKDGLEMEAKQAQSEYAYATKNVEVSKKNLNLASEIRRKTLIKFKEGVSASLELTQADRQYQESQGQYIGSLFQLLNAKTKLDKALSKY